MHHRIFQVLFGAALTLGGMPGLVMAAEKFTATLTEAQEVPPSGSTASGSAQLSLNAAGDALTISIQISGLDLDGNQTLDPDDDVTGLHIHSAPAGVNGGVVFGMISPSSDLDDLAIDPVAGTVSSVWDGAEGNATTLAEQLDNLRNEGLYINVHTPVNPGGEIRGQIVPVATSPVPALGLTGVALAIGIAVLLGGLQLRRKRA